MPGKLGDEAQAGTLRLGMHTQQQRQAAGAASSGGGAALSKRAPRTRQAAVAARAPVTGRPRGKFDSELLEP